MYLFGGLDSLELKSVLRGTQRMCTRKTHLEQDILLYKILSFLLGHRQTRDLARLCIRLRLIRGVYVQYCTFLIPKRIIIGPITHIFTLYIYVVLGVGCVCVRLRLGELAVGFGGLGRFFWGGRRTLFYIYIEERLFIYLFHNVRI